MPTDPDAVKYKIRGHLIFLAVALLGGAAVVLRGTFGGSSVDEAGKVAAGITGFIAIAHLLLALCAPLHASLRLLAALLLVCLAPVGFLYPVFTCPDQGWPINPGKGLRVVETPSSRIIAPGDSVDVSWTPEGVESVGALWSGIPQVEVLNADETGCPSTLPATGRIETWDRIIWTESYLQECPPFLTARFRIPEDDQLIGKTLKFRITLPFIYPAPEGRSGYVDKKKTVVREDDVLLAASSVKAAYWTSWKWGATIGMTGTTVGGFMLVLLTVGIRGGWTATRDAIALAPSQNQAQAHAERLQSASLRV